jgi:HEAT repeat protein
MAARSLASVGVVPGVADVLAGAMADSDPAVRKQAAVSLGRTPWADPAIYRPLLAATTDRDPEVRSAILATLASHARAVVQGKSLDFVDTIRYLNAIRSGLSDPSVPTRRVAAGALSSSAQVGDNVQDALDPLINKALSDGDPVVRASAVDALAWPFDSGLLPADGSRIARRYRTISRLLIALRDEDERPRGRARQALRSILQWMSSIPFRRDPIWQERLMAASLEGLNDPNATTRADTVALFRFLGPISGGDGAFLNRQLRIALHDPQLPVRRAGAEAIEEIIEANSQRQYATDRIVDTFVLFVHEDEMTRDLMRAGPFGIPARLRDYARTLDIACAQAQEGLIPLLRESLRDDDPQVRRVAYACLWRSRVPLWIGQDPLREELRAITKTYLLALDSKDPMTREIAAWSLSWTDPRDAVGAITALKRHAKDPGTRVRVRVQEALAAQAAVSNRGSKIMEPRWPAWSNAAH